MHRVSSVNDPNACARCGDAEDLGFEIAMAFQPIVDLPTGDPVAFEALVRGPEGQGAGWVFERITEGTRYRFDQTCRTVAIRTAAEVDLPAALHINFLPNAVYHPERCLRTTLAAASRYAFPTDRIVFELTEGEQVADKGHMREIVEHYQSRGFRTAIDDFGAGYAGLNLLAAFQTDFVKIDMELIRDLPVDPPRRTIVGGIVRICEELGIGVIAEGIETKDERDTLLELGVTRQQGYLFAKPALRALPEVPPDALR